jgi:hypothetical protein
VGEINDAARKFPDESVANVAAEEKFVGVTVEQGIGSDGEAP